MLDPNALNRPNASELTRTPFWYKSNIRTKTPQLRRQTSNPDTMQDSNDLDQILSYIVSHS